ncbi:unnamed protein product [Jaminaea pallidilutea]
MDGILRKQLKSWQNDFRSKHGREPRRKDIAQVPEIAAIYDTWTAMAKAGANGNASTNGSASTGETSKSGSRGIPKESSSGIPSSSKRSRSAAPGKDKRTLLQSSPKRSRPSMPPPETPTKSLRNVGPSTPTHSSNRNPFRTPTKTPTSERIPSTPSSEVKLRTPVKAQLETQGNNETASDSRFHYNASPSSYRALVGSYSKTLSPNHSRAPMSSKEQDASLLKQFTPRTKARKRLRGEDVPPTPQSQQKQNSSHSPSQQRDGRSKGLSSQPPRKRRAQGRQGALSEYWSTSSMEQRAPSFEDRSSKATPGGIAKPPMQQDGDIIEASPKKAAPSRFDLFQKSADYAEHSSQRKFTSLLEESERHNGSHSDDEEQEEQAQPDSTDGDYMLATEDTMPDVSARAMSTRPLMSQRVSVDLDSDEENAKASVKEAARHSASESPSKAIYLRAYQRFGELQIGDCQEQRDTSSDEETPVQRYLSPSKRQQMRRSTSGARSFNDDEDSDGGDVNLGQPRIAPSALMSMHQHRKQSQRQALENLFQGSSRANAAEIEQELRAEAQRRQENGNETARFPGDRSKGSQTWGQAKAAAKHKAGNSKANDRFLLGKAKRGFGNSLGTAVSDDEEGDDNAGRPRDESTTVPPAPASQPKVFRRLGRSGVDDDEVVRTSRPADQRQPSDDEDAGGEQYQGQADEDWASEAESDQWGVGDGEMDASDVY